MQLTAHGAQFDMERGGHHGVIGAGDVGELGVHLRADIVELDGMHGAPGLAVAVQRQVQHAADDALLGLREVAAFHTGVEAAVAAEQVVHHQEHEVRVVHEQRGAPQRLHVDQVQVGRHRQVAHKVAVLLDPDRADRDVGAAADEVEQRRAQRPREALVDDFERVQAATDDPFLGSQVVRPHPAFINSGRAAGCGRIGFARYAFQ
ncbi:hypothetical protein D3C81_1444960 [compost metagenome]